MKPAGLFMVLALGGSAALPGAEAGTGIISGEISAKIREGLPAYRPPPPDTGTDAEASARPVDPDVLVLPKMTVKERRLPRDAADHLMGRDDFKRKLENIYLDELAKVGPLNYFLNQFTIPILSPSKAERGRAIYRARELDRLRHVSDAARTLAPEAAAALERELDNFHTIRPAGGLQRR
jgi:hypothetical protein